MLGNMARPTTIIVLIVVLILLFGAKRLPDAARALGRSLRIIKAETRDLVAERTDDDLDEKADARSARQPLPPESGGEAVAGEVVDPPERSRDR
jgi:sec-independent protein translocase protein TatA